MRKQIPSESAEQAILMCMVRAPRLYDEIKFLVKEHHFILEESQKFLNIIKNWVNVNKDDLKKIGFEEFVSYVEIQYPRWYNANKGYLLNASKKIIDSEQALEKWKHYYKILENFYNCNNYIDILQKSIKEAEENPLDVRTHIQRHQTSILKNFSGINLLESDSSLEQVIAEFRVEFLERMKKSYSPAYLGLKSFDEMHGGFYPWHYALLTARSSVGKSALCLCGAKYMLTKQYKKVLFFNLETNNFQFLVRWFGQDVGISPTQLKDPKLLTKEQRNHVLDLSKHLLKEYKNTLHLVDDIYDVDKMVEKIMSIQKAYGLDVVFIDLIEYIKTRGYFENGTKKLAHISDTFFQLRKRIPIVIIMIQQQNKEGEKGGAQTAGRGSEDPYMQSDSSLALYRAKDEDGNIDLNKRELVTNKNRDGNTGTVTVKFNKELTMFEDDVLGGDLD